MQELFLPQAEAEAAKRVGGRPKSDAENLAPIGARLSEIAKAHEIAAKQSNGLATVRTLERMAPVRNAPKTRERVRSGEIQSAGRGVGSSRDHTSRTTHYTVRLFLSLRDFSGARCSRDGAPDPS